MDTQTILKYVMNSPENTNPNVLKGMLDELSEGGGGSSDFSTAEVTVIKEEESLNGLILPTILDDICEIQKCQSGIYTVPLYKGSLFIKDIQNLGIIESASGDIEELSEEKVRYYRIFGDCTITIS